MNKPPNDLTAAQIDVERARARLTATAHELHDRLKPDTLMRKSVDRLRVRSSEIADDVIDVARAKPALIGGVSAGMLLVWLRRPIGRLGRRLFFKADETDRPGGRVNDADGI